MPKKSKGLSSDLRELMILKQNLTGKLPEYHFHKLRQEGHPSVFKQALIWIRVNLPLRKLFFHPEYPSNPSGIEFSPLFEPMTAQREIRWAGAYLSVSGAKLGGFVKLSEDFQRTLLLDDYIQCEKVLKSIEEQFGQSLWLLKNKISFLQASGGLEAQKQFRYQISNNIDAITNFIVYYISVRNERTISPARFSADFSQTLRELKVNEEIRTYLQFHIDPLVLLPKESIAPVLNLQSFGCLIDYYEAFMLLCRNVVVSGYLELFPSIALALKELRPIVEDTRIGLLLLAIGESPLQLSENSKPLIEAVNLLLAGKYEEARNVAFEAMKADPVYYDLLEVAARASSIVSYNDESKSEHKMLFEIVRRMTAVIRKEASIDEHVVELSKIATKFFNYPWANALESFIRKEVSSDPFEDGKGMAHFAAIGLSPLSPLRISSFPRESERKDYVKALNFSYADSLATRYANIQAYGITDQELLAGLTSEEILLIKSESTLINGNYQDCLETSLELAKTDIEYFRQRAIRIVCHSLLKLVELRECIKIITIIHITEERLRPILPIAETIEAIDKKVRNELGDEISLPILFDLYSKHISDDKDHLRAYAYEDFLNKIGIKRPSELKTMVLRFDRAMLIYFLRFLCVESIMDTSTEFKGSLDVAEERLAVCRLLIDLDEPKAVLYETEMKEILRRVTIQKRIREIEQRKIYVDTESIKASAKKSLEETFNRYISFVREEVPSEVFISELKAILKKAGLDTEDQVVLLKLPKNEAEEILTSLILDLRDKFVYGTEHGLDGYLSVRIRHGALESQLRGPLDAGKLITQRDHLTDEYKPNHFWLEKLETTDLGLRDEIINKLTFFSKGFDDLVHTIKAEWIQVKINKEGKGLFDFTLTNLDVYQLSALVDKYMSFEDFVDKVFDLLNKRLEQNLECIRETLKTTAKQTLNTLLNNLLTFFDQLAEIPGKRDITYEISKAHTQAQIEMDRIREWFRLSKTTANEPFHIDEAVRISEGFVRTSSPDFRADVRIINNTDFLLKGSFLHGLVDIFLNVFDNIVKHSKTEEPPKADVVITYLASSIHCLIENEIGSEIDSDVVLGRINSIKAAMKEGTSLKLVNIEGGTGFHKIRKILTFDFQVEPIMDFGIRGDGRFFVEFSIPTLRQAR